jgi:hypothetical protein
MSNFHNFSPSISPDKIDLLLPLPRGGRRSPRSRFFAFLYKDGLPTVGTEGYTDDSMSSCDEVGALLENLVEEHPHAPHDKNSDNADEADAIIEANEEMWLDRDDLCDLKGQITRALDGGTSRHAIVAIISDFLDQTLADEQLSEAEEDCKIAVERLDEAKDAYKQLCSDAAQSLVHRLASPSATSHLKGKWSSRMADKNRIALAQRACGRSLVARICRAQIDHNLSRWLALLDEGSARFAQRSCWLLRQQDNLTKKRGNNRPSKLRTKSKRLKT